MAIIVHRRCSLFTSHSLCLLCDKWTPQQMVTDWFTVEMQVTKTKNDTPFMFLRKPGKENTHKKWQSAFFLALFLLIFLLHIKNYIVFTDKYLDYRSSFKCLTVKNIQYIFNFFFICFWYTKNFLLYEVKSMSFHLKGIQELSKCMLLYSATKSKLCGSYIWTKTNYSEQRLEESFKCHCCLHCLNTPEAASRKQGFPSIIFLVWTV